MAYLLLLTAAANFAPKSAKGSGNTERTKFAFLIPAHNEELLLPKLLESIRKSTYPTTHYDIHVIADNCTDQTADVAAVGGALAHSRFDSVLIGKGYALKWGLEQIREDGLVYDAFIIVDADSEISPGFLGVMDRKIQAGANVLQAYYAVKDPARSWNISLRYAAFTVLHFLRPQGRMALGGSAGLKGNGMVFASEIMAQFPWPASITEDIEYHMLLLLNGYTVQFAPDAVVWTEMPSNFRQSQSQLDRWEYGRLEMARKYVPMLMEAAAAAFKRGDFRRVFPLLDAVMEHVILPFSMLVTAAVGFFVVDAAALWAAYGVPSLAASIQIAWISALLGLFLILGQIIYLLTGLKLAQAPWVVYQRLLFAPVFIFMKAGQLFKLLIGNRPQGWVKTVRNQD